MGGGGGGHILEGTGTNLGEEGGHFGGVPIIEGVRGGFCNDWGGPHFGGDVVGGGYGGGSLIMGEVSISGGGSPLTVNVWAPSHYLEDYLGVPWGGSMKSWGGLIIGGSPFGGEEWGGTV